MDFNLLKDAWIPVRCKDGSQRTVSPAQIGDPSIVWPDWSRPDFNVATLEFLIGLLQTICPPQSETEWADQLKSPKTAEGLRDAFAPFAGTFEFGDGKFRFMQEHGDTLKFTKSINRLLFETPGDKTVNLNKDFFVKRVEDFAVTPPIAAIGLFTRQIYDNGFGGGFRSTLRGAGAMVTLILGETLWETVWLNVMSAPDFNREKVPVTAGDPKIFPWMGPTKSSEEKTAPPILQNDMHPLHVFWSMPNRIQLSFETGNFVCAISGENTEIACRELITSQHGMNYDGPFTHPLSPFYLKDEKFSFRTGSELSGRGGTYRSYGDLAFVRQGDHKPALVVSNYQTRHRGKRAGGKTRRMLCAGWNLSKAKALGFVNLTMPIYPLEGEQLQKFQRIVDELTSAAEEAAKVLMTGVCRALYAEPSSKANGGFNWKYGERKHIYGSTLGEQVEEQFWHSTEPAFFVTLDGLFRCLEDDDYEDKADEAKLKWLKELGKAAHRVFDAVLDGTDFQQSKPKSLVIARQELYWFLESSSFYKLLDLTKPETKGAA